MIALACLVLGQAALKPYVLEGFRVALPAAPVLDAAATTARTKVWLVHAPDGATITLTTVGRRDRVADDVAVALFVTDLTFSTKSVLTHQKDVLLDGWRGLEAGLRGPEGLTWCRAYACPDVLFGVAGAGGKASKPLIDAVLASVRFDPKRGHGPYRAAGPIWSRIATGPSYTVDYPAKPARQDFVGAAGDPSNGWVATCGNRVYATYISRMAEGAFRLKGKALTQSLESAGAKVAVSAGGKVVDQKATTVMGSPTVTTEAVSAEDGRTTFFQVTAHSRKIVILAAGVPTCWKDAPEIVRFLGTVRPAAEKTPPGG